MADNWKDVQKNKTVSHKKKTSRTNQSGNFRPPWKPQMNQESLFKIYYSPFISSSLLPFLQFCPRPYILRKHIQIISWKQHLQTSKTKNNAKISRWSCFKKTSLLSDYFQKLCAMNYWHQRHLPFEGKKISQMKNGSSTVYEDK